MVLLLQGESEDAVRERAYEVCQNLRHEIRQFLGWDTLAAIGLPVTRLSALPDSYRTAKETMLRAAACAEGGVFGSTDFASGKTGFDFSAGGALADQLRHAAPEDVPRIVDEYFGNAAEEDMKSVLYRYYLLMDLLVSAARLAAEVQPDSITAPDDPQAVLAQATTLEGAKACAAQTLRRLTRLCYRHQNVRYSEEIGRAKTFIRANYSDSGLSLHMVAAEVGFSPNHFSLCYRHQNVRYSEEIGRAKTFIRANYSDSGLSLHMVAAEVGFSPNHFSTIFSQETGQTFVEYLTAVRLEAAKELLRTSDARMSDIAFDVGPNHFSTIFSQETGQTFVEYLTAVRLEAAKELLRTSDARMSDIAFDVGYQEPHYFSYLFKKHVGMSPREYRSRGEVT